MKKKVDWLLDCEPRPVQLEALKRSYPKRGYCHFLEMRLGKTPTALNEFMLFRRDHGFRRMIILAPNRYKAIWILEAKRFGVDVPAHSFESSKRAEAEEFLRDNPDGLLALNYEALRSGATLAMLKRYVDDKTFLVADESVLIKTPSSMTTKRAIVLSKLAGAVRALTGLPNPQGPHEFWSQSRFVGAFPGLNYWAFRARHCQMGGYQGRKIVGCRDNDKLMEALAPHSFIARRRDWGVSREVDFELAEIQMPKVMADAYAEMETEFLLELEGAEINAAMAMTKHQKLQQIVSGFAIDVDGKPRPVMPFDSTPKWLDLRERLTTEMSGKVIIVAWFRNTVNNLWAECYLMGLNPAMIGTLAAESPADAMTRFNEDKDCRVIICQQQSARHGLTLMGHPDDPCLSTVMFETSYSYEMFAQMIERNQGHEQVAGTHVLQYASSKVERAILKALRNREDVAMAILNYYGVTK